MATKTKKPVRVKSLVKTESATDAAFRRKSRRKKTPRKKKPRKQPPVPDNTGTILSVWQDDPAKGDSADGGKLMQVGVPDLSASTLPTIIRNPKKAPDPKIFKPGSNEFRYWTAASALNQASVFWSSILPDLRWQGNKAKLPVGLDEGEDLNAFYDREGLSFFHGAVGSRTVFSGESPDVVCHEHGHAVLDSIKPQLWDAASIEVGAFHESFGDMSAMLCALQYPSVRRDLLVETAGSIFRSSDVSRLAEQLGWAIRQEFPAAVDADCLRNAVNSFVYRDPDTIPSSAPSGSLSSEPHSFSRVFTAAFFEGLAGMFKSTAKQDEANLLKVSQDMGKILAAGIQAAAVVPSFYSQVAANMVVAANNMFAGSGYSDAIRSAFIRRGILTIADAATFSQPERVKGIAGSDKSSYQKELPKLILSVAEYGLGINNIIVHAASEAKRFDVTGASLSVGRVVARSEDEAARSFLEDLLRRGKVKVQEGTRERKVGISVTRVNEPTTHHTHTHELREEGSDFVLRRVRIDCGFH